MATTEVTLVGDLANIVDVDFAKAWVRLRANDARITDPDADKIRISTEEWQEVAADGTFSFENVIGSVDTVVPGTLQYYIDVRVNVGPKKREITLGPYRLDQYDDGDTVELSDLDAEQPIGLVRQVPLDPDLDVLTEAQAYTDDRIDAHEGADDAHPIYAQLVDADGTPIQNARLLLIPAGAPFPEPTPNTLMIYGGI